MIFGKRLSRKGNRVTTIRVNGLNQLICPRCGKDGLVGNATEQHVGLIVVGHQFDMFPLHIVYIRNTGELKGGYLTKIYCRHCDFETVEEVDRIELEREREYTNHEPKGE
jgi:hypothetical protein